MVALTDEEKILQLAGHLRAYGVDPVELLKEQVRAEGYCERRLRADDPESLAEVLRANRVSAFPDVFESPTFRKRLRLIRLDAEGWPPGEPTRSTGADGVTTVELPPMNWAKVVKALQQLKRIGVALAYGSERPAHRPSMRGSAWEQTAETNPDGSKEYQLAGNIRRNVSMYFGMLKASNSLTRGLTDETKVSERLTSARSINPSFIPVLSRTLVKLRAPRAAGRDSHLTLKEAAVLLAYRREIDPKNKVWAESKAEALAKRKK
jgi:hypothetical protein